MVTARPGNGGRRRSGAALLVELTVAVGILAVVLAGFAASYGQDVKLLRAYYYRAAAMEIVDGEMEALAAGEWRAYGEGRHDYAVRAESAKSLPDGRFVLTVGKGLVRLEWCPDRPGKAPRVVREARIP